MTPEEIKTRPEIKLKPNNYLKDPNQPRLYQRRMILMTLLRSRMVNGDDVGLGKTIETIGHFTYLKHLKPDARALVLTERTALIQWQKEIAKFTTGLKTRIITAETHKDKDLRIKAFRSHGVDLVISTYSLVYDYAQYMMEGLQPYYLLYCDEPNFFKNTTTVLHKAMTNIAQEAQRCYGMTATIVENRLEEAYGIFRIIAPDIIGGRLDFEKNYCRKEKVPGKRIWVVKSYKNLDKFREQIAPVYYGRLGHDPEVEQDLPEVITKDVEIILTPAQSAKLLEITDRLVTLPEGNIKQLGILDSMTLAQQVADDMDLVGWGKEAAKKEALMETLTNSLLGQKTVVYSRFRSMVDRLEDSLRAAGIKYGRITGAETAQQRSDAQESFQRLDGGITVLLCTRAGQKAINLQTGAHLFFYDIPWSYGQYRQMVGRLRRAMSPHKKIGVYRYLAVLHPDYQITGGNKTIDHYTLRVVKKKKKLFNAITGDATDIETTEGDIIEIFREIKAGHRFVQEELEEIGDDKI